MENIYRWCLLLTLMHWQSVHISKTVNLATVDLATVNLATVDLAIVEDTTY